MSGDDLLAKVRKYQADIETGLAPAVELCDSINRWIAEGKQIRHELRSYLREHKQQMAELYQFVREHVDDSTDADWWKVDGS